MTNLWIHKPKRQINRFIQEFSDNLIFTVNMWIYTYLSDHNNSTLLSFLFFLVYDGLWDTGFETLT